MTFLKLDPGSLWGFIQQVGSKTLGGIAEVIAAGWPTPVAKFLIIVALIR